LALTINIVNPVAGANTPGMAEGMRQMSREGRAPRLVEPEEMVPPLLYIVSCEANQINGWRFEIKSPARTSGSRCVSARVLEDPLRQWKLSPTDLCSRSINPRQRFSLVKWARVRRRLIGEPIRYDPPVDDQDDCALHTRRGIDRQGGRLG